MIKIFEETGIKGKNINTIKDIYDKRMANIIIKSLIKQGCPFSSFLFNIVPDTLLSTIKYKKKMKWIQKGQEEIKFVNTFVIRERSYKFY